MLQLRLLFVHLFHALAVLPQDLLIVTEFGLVKVIVQGDHIHQEVKYFNFADDLLNVDALQSFSVGHAGMERSSMRQLGDEHLASESEEDRRLRRNHADVLVGLHNFLYSGEGQLLLLEGVEFVGLPLDFLSDFGELYVQFF